jgi:hypothetical protein
MALGGWSMILADKERQEARKSRKGLFVASSWWPAVGAGAMLEVGETSARNEANRHWERARRPPEPHWGPACKRSQSERCRTGRDPRDRERGRGTNKANSPGVEIPHHSNVRIPARGAGANSHYGSMRTCQFEREFEVSSWKFQVSRKARSGSGLHTRTKAVRAEQTQSVWRKRNRWGKPHPTGYGPRPRRPVVQTNPISGGAGRDAGPLLVAPASGRRAACTNKANRRWGRIRRYSTIPPFQPDVNCAKQTQFGEWLNGS